MSALPSSTKPVMVMNRCAERSNPCSPPLMKVKASWKDLPSHSPLNPSQVLKANHSRGRTSATTKSSARSGAAGWERFT